MSERITFKRSELVSLLTDLAARCVTVQGLAERVASDPADNHLAPAIVAVAGGLGFTVDTLLAKVGAGDCAGMVDITDWVHPVLAEMSVEVQP